MQDLRLITVEPTIDRMHLRPDDFGLITLHKLGCISDCLPISCTSGNRRISSLSFYLLPTSTLFYLRTSGGAHCKDEQTLTRFTIGSHARHTAQDETTTLLPPPVLSSSAFVQNHQGFIIVVLGWRKPLHPYAIRDYASIYYHKHISEGTRAA